MLGKLLKYDLKSYRNMFILMHGVLLAVALGSGISLSEMVRKLDGYSGIGLVTVLLLFTYIIAVLTVNILGLVLIIRRFYTNLFGNEGYLSFTLPVTAAQHFASKVISSVIWLICSALLQALSVVILLSGFAGHDSGVFGDLYEIFGQGFSQLMSQDNLIWQAVTGAFNALAGLLMVYFAVCLGQTVNRHRVLSAVIIYFGLNFVLNLISSLLTDAFVSFDLYGGGELVSYGTGYYVVTALFLALRLAAFSIGSVWIMRKKLNLE